MSFKKILITGGTGFVGKHLREELQRRVIGYVVFGKSECDLTRLEQAEAMFVRHRNAGAIVHLAGVHAGADYPAKHGAELLQANGRIHLNVLACWQKYMPGAKLMGVGSACVYPPSNVADGSKEEMALAGELEGGAYAFAFSKRLLLNGIRAYNDQYQLNGTYVIPATMFGEYDDFHAETAHAPGALIGKFVRAVVENLPTVEVRGDGTQVRDFLDSKEFVAGLLQILEKCQRDVVNVGPGKGTSVRALAEMINEASGFKGEVV